MDFWSHELKISLAVIQNYATILRDPTLTPEQRTEYLDHIAQTTRRLDASVTKKGTVASLIVGILSALIMGAGMSLCMVWPDLYMLPGIVIGVVGMVGVALAYPLFARITRQEQERIAPQILKLTEELMQ